MPSAVKKVMPRMLLLRCIRHRSPLIVGRASTASHLLSQHFGKSATEQHAVLKDEISTNVFLRCRLWCQSLIERAAGLHHCLTELLSLSRSEIHVHMSLQQTRSSGALSLIDSLLCQPQTRISLFLEMLCLIRLLSHVP